MCSNTTFTWMARKQGDELLLDEDRLAIKDVDGWIGDLAVDE